MEQIPLALSRFGDWLSSSLLSQLVDAQVSFFTKERWAQTLGNSYEFRDTFDFLIADNICIDNKHGLSRLKIASYAQKAYLTQASADRKIFFLSTMIWGYGDRPRGDNIPRMLNSPHLDKTLNTAMNFIAEDKLLAAFDIFAAQTSKIDHLNSSFFTKLLYFAGLASKNATLPLILDSRIVSNWKTLTGVQLDQYKVDDYLKYIETVNRWATHLHCRADAIEYWIFISPYEFLES